ncbi:MAG: DUF4091 domain-containing protein [Candidatus Anammoximicrobium sp.]|nr:DUF4091 domain-containing protein [Candidatus Anammoximicrobium sp.]
MNALLFAMLVVTAQSDLPASGLFDLGSGQSAVWEGCTRVTRDQVFSPQAGFGWQSKDGLTACVRAHTAMVENRSRGRDEPPPIWTNPITEDAILGDCENAFLFQAPPGDYEVYVLCGASEALSAQYFDFTVQVGDDRQRVQFEGGYRFRAVRFRARAGAEPLAVQFTPRSKWAVCALLIWQAADAARVQQQLIAPLEEWTFRMPPAEWAQWQEDPEPDSGPAPALSDADRQRGFVVSSRHYLECVYPHTQPRPADIQPTLRLFATPGEYEPMSFVVHPVRDLRDARVTVSDLGPVPARNIDVRRVRFLRARPNYTVRYRYRVVPDVLERFQSLDLAAGENARFWITAHVPDDAPGGTYRGAVTFECSGGKVELPVTLRILPFTLRDDPGKLFGIYYRHPYDLAARATDDVSRKYFRRRAELEHADMVAHGTRNAVLSCGSSAADAEGNFQFRWELLADQIELWRKFAFRGPIVMHISTGAIYRKYVKEPYGSHLRGVQDPPEAFGRELTALVKAIEAERTKRGWPEFLYYPVDEPSTDPAAVNFMAKVLQACRDAGVRTYVTADPTHDPFAPLRPLIDVWCTQPFAPDRETIQADMRTRGVEYWCYPNHVNGENDHTPVTGARMTYGFGFWRSGFLTLIPWIYSSSTGDPFNYLDGPSMDFFNRHEPDGTPIPVALWEAYREGYDDYRYVYTLEQLIAEAKQRPQAACQDAAAAAQRELQAVWDAIRVQAKYKYDGLWSPAEFDVYRWLIAQQILSVQQALAP